MPYARETLTQLRQQVAQDIASALVGSDPLLRFSTLNIMGVIQAGLAHMHNGFIDYIAQQSNPFTATDEYLEAWAALKGVFRIAATPSSGAALYTGTNGVEIPSGTPLVRGDGLKYVSTATLTIAGGTVTLPATAVKDPAGLVGANSDCDVGTVLTLGTTIAGVNSNGVAASNFVGGADLETDDSLRARMLLAYQTPAHGGSAADYVAWALAVPGVTRAWCVPNVYGSGTVGVYVMLDAVQAAHGGFPQGTNGVSQNDHGPVAGAPRDVVATGDQLVVADALIAAGQPVTALAYVIAPTASAVNFTIDGIPGASSAVKTAINGAIDSVLLQYAQITGAATTVDISFVNSAIAAVAGTSGFVISSPAGNIVTASGALPVRGTVTYGA